MYKYSKGAKSTMTSVKTTEGETIEKKIQRIVHNNEPITDGAPEIYTPRKDGVISGYNIRTDRWEVAAEAMDAVTRSIEAKREANFNEKLAKTVSGESNDGVESIQGKPAPEADTK